MATIRRFVDDMVSFLGLLWARVTQELARVPGAGQLEVKRAAIRGHLASLDASLAVLGPASAAAPTVAPGAAPAAAAVATSTTVSRAPAPVAAEPQVDGLVRRCRDLRAAMALYRDGRDSVALGTRIDECLLLLEPEAAASGSGLVAQFARLAKVHQAMSAYGVAPEYAAGDLPGLRRLAAALRESPIAEADLTAAKRLFNAARGLPAVAERILAALDAAWKGLVRQHPDPVAGQEDWLRLLAQDPARADAVQRIDCLRRERREVASRLPTEEGDLRGFTDVAAGLAELWGQLGLADAPDDVRAFISSVKRGEATLGDLTVPILEWLTARGLATPFRVREMGGWQ
jgi:hypothetical protein